MIILVIIFGTLVLPIHRKVFLQVVPKPKYSDPGSLQQPKKINICIEYDPIITIWSIIILAVVILISLIIKYDLPVELPRVPSMNPVLKAPT